MKILLRVRDLEQDDTRDVEFESEEAAHAYLVARPRMRQVLGVPCDGVPGEVSARLREAARPLDWDERAAAARVELAHKHEAERRALERSLERERQEELWAAELAAADPLRPIRVRWTLDDGFQNLEDDRPLTDELREAVLAYARERDEWVRDRGQVVGEVVAEVYPGPVPEGEERVLPGARFVGVTAPEPS